MAVTVHADDAEVAARIRALLGGLRSTDPPPPATTTEVVVTSGPWPNRADLAERRHQVFIDGIIHLQTHVTWQVDDVLLGHLNGRALGVDVDDLHLHAALVSRRGVGLLLLGASGSGKSTLAVHLARRGWTLHGDEMVVVEADGAVRAFTRPPTLKRGSWPFFADLPSVPRPDAEDPARDRAHVPFAEIDVDAPRDRDRPVRPVAAIFVGHGASEVGLRPRTPTDALAGLVADTLDLERAGRRGFDRVVGLADGIPAFDLDGGSPDESADVLEHLVDQASPAPSAGPVSAEAANERGGLWRLGGQAVVYDLVTGRVATVDDATATVVGSRLGRRRSAPDDADDADVVAVREALAEAGIGLWEAAR